jgi:hypothetical protein
MYDYDGGFGMLTQRKLAIGKEPTDTEPEQPGSDVP